ncbi:MAG TPA: PEGA domain-containing protein [Thermoguttaceae bacterium]|nr:PEGA domain-containing protein [Thermoguttaceae bacterium]
MFVRVAVVLTTLTLFVVIDPLSALAQSPGLRTQEKPQTLLLVKTTPAGAEIRLDGRPVGASGELLPVEPGTYRLVVDMAGHKPYRQQITIEDGRVTRIELDLDRIDSTNAQLVSQTLLKHDDGSAEGRRSIGGSGEMIRFTLPEGKWEVKGIQLHGSRYGYPQAPAEDFTVHFLDKDFAEVAAEEAPYRLFRRGEAKWVPVRFREPVEVPEEFWVCVNFNAEQTKGVYVSFDTSTGGKFSKVGLPGEEAKDVEFGGDWMIRVELAPADEAKSTTAAATDRATLKRDDNRPDGKRSIGGSGEMIRYTLPEGNWKVRGIQLHGSRYGMPQAPAEDFQIYFLDKDLAGVVATENAPYRQFQRGKERWVRIHFKSPVEVPKEFWVCVNFNAHQTKGVYVSYDTSSGGKHSKFGLPEGEKTDVEFGGDWMIRVDLIGSEKAAASGGHLTTATPDAAPPRIVATGPRVGAREVDPALTEITVTFDRDMATGFSWTGGGPDFPPGTEGQTPFWRDKRTAVYPVTLEAERYYRIGVNSDSFRNFKSVEGVPAEPMEIYFTTVGADNETIARLETPRIVSMTPVNGAKDADPNLRTIRVEFDRPMGEGISWVGGGPHYPEVPDGKKPHWSKDGKTCYLPVNLKPGWDYRLGLNSPSFKNFKSRAGVALKPVIYSFHTRDK